VHQLQAAGAEHGCADDPHARAVGRGQGEHRYRGDREPGAHDRQRGGKLQALVRAVQRLSIVD
jgi:hypothetical protein